MSLLIQEEALNKDNVMELNNRELEPLINKNEDTFTLLKATLVVSCSTLFIFLRFDVPTIKRIIQLIITVVVATIIWNLHLWEVYIISVLCSGF